MVKDFNFMMVTNKELQQFVGKKKDYVLEILSSEFPGTPIKVLFESTESFTKVHARGTIVMFVGTQNKVKTIRVVDQY